MTRDDVEDEEDGGGGGGQKGGEDECPRGRLQPEVNGDKLGQLLDLLTHTVKNCLNLKTSYGTKVIW